MYVLRGIVLPVSHLGNYSEHLHVSFACLESTCLPTCRLIKGFGGEAVFLINLAVNFKDFTCQLGFF